MVSAEIKNDVEIDGFGEPTAVAIERQWKAARDAGPSSPEKREALEGLNRLRDGKTTWVGDENVLRLAVDGFLEIHGMGIFCRNREEAGESPR